MEELRQENDDLHQRLTKYESEEDEDDSEKSTAKRGSSSSSSKVDAAAAAAMKEKMKQEGLEELVDASPTQQLDWLLAERRKWTADLEAELEAGGGRGGAKMLSG